MRKEQEVVVKLTITPGASTRYTQACIDVLKERKEKARLEARGKQYER